jgi:hypothetical protein
MSLKDPDPMVDPNFEDNLQSKRSRDKSMIISKIDFGKTLDQEGKSSDENLSVKKNHVMDYNFRKEPIKSERKNIEPQRNII